MIRFETKQLGYLMASRAFGAAAGTCGSDTERQLLRAQGEYDRFCRRHGHERKFMLGINRAFHEFVQARGTHCVSRETSAMHAKQHPAVAAVPRWPQAEGRSASRRQGSPMPFWRKQHEPLALGSVPPKAS